MHTPIVHEDVKAAIKAASQEAFPAEAWGFVVRRGGRSTVHHGKNVASDPQKRFRSRAQDWVDAEAHGGKIEIIWHSHPNGKPEAGMADKVNAESNQLPILIYALPADLWAFYEPAGFEAPLAQRPFVHGILDCYSLARDYYKRTLDIDLPDFHRPDDWWLPLREAENGNRRRSQHDRDGRIIAPPLNLYMENFTHAGFHRVESLRKHDSILMRLFNGPVCHSAIYLGDGKILHHPPDRNSRVVAYSPGGGGFYEKCTECYLRHESMLHTHPEPRDNRHSHTVLAEMPSPAKLPLPNRANP